MATSTCGAGGARLRILNLGCGVKTSDSPAVTNIDWSFYLRLKRMGAGGRAISHLLGRHRRTRLESLRDNVIVHDLSKGIPSPDSSVDAVYHSHMLEHLDRPVATEFMREVHRVLKPDGIQRIVVPDLEQLCRAIVKHLDTCGDPAERARHNELVAALLEQAVRRESAATRDRHGVAVQLEKLVVGDARRRGETHQWMYDWANLTALLEETGFDSIATLDHTKSAIPDWSSYGLDLDEAGGEHKPGSLYVEARAADSSTPTSRSM